MCYLRAQLSGRWGKLCLFIGLLILFTLALPLTASAAALSLGRAETDSHAGFWIEVVIVTTIAVVVGVVRYRRDKLDG